MSNSLVVVLILLLIAAFVAPLIWNLARKKIDT
ncbi:hypothetical protein OSB_25710 [Octadecabacter temperatus]|uniref:Uncharacterized protein n=1 Tax=Octadecabacter temperatus TaxID=1458307 RepID=A0A0K0Y884_9RHOB|nr:hypothetical protein OSB_25710 [Octadecabacter temperatus]